MSGRQFTYSQLLHEHGLIQVPMIQRDYAQGRESEQEVRDEFLSALADALQQPASAPTLPLNLDFVYGSVEGAGNESKFAPLDGQQRLTTLFLLHWFLAWHDNRWETFDSLFLKDGHSRFTYRVRPSSTEFFDFLVTFHPQEPPNEVKVVSTLIKNQPGYFRSWQFDPTIQSTMVMLDAIRNRFVKSDGLFERLIDTEKPAITFQLLPLDNFGLSDDLYIRMNARGMPLTPFETFKARYEHELKRQYVGQTRTIGEHEFAIHDFVSRRMDTAWMDLFWAESKVSRNRSTDVDRSMLNLCRVVALITRNPELDACLSAIEILTRFHPNYTTFHKNGWLDEEFTSTLIPVLEMWCNGSGFRPLLPNQNYFDEQSIFRKLTADSSNLEVSEILMFMGYAYYIRTHEAELEIDGLQEWMRVVHNLVINSTNIDRADRLPGGMKGLLALLPESHAILEYLAAIDPTESIGTFAKMQIAEEALKSALIVHHDRWKPLIDRAELHGYFRGQIGFLLEFSGTASAADNEPVAEWDAAIHEGLQSCFEEYLTKAEAMFDSSGVADKKRTFIWQRALLSVGDYMFPMTAHRHCFLLDAYTEANSWKRLLRGYTGAESSSRALLKTLWDQLDDQTPLTEQLSNIVANASGVGSWREALIASSSAMRYCSKHIIRRESSDQVYLLAKMQMNGAHAELFTYCLFCDTFKELEKRGDLQPLELRYFYAKDRDLEPGIQFGWDHGSHSIPFGVEWTGTDFIIFVRRTELSELDDVAQTLIDAGFEDSESRLQKNTAADGLVDEIDALREAMEAFSS